MNTRVIVTALALAAIFLSSALAGVVTRKRGSANTDSNVAPWAAAGLTERQATAHLLDRFTFGPAPGQIDEVVAEGLEQWFERQLAAGGSSDVLAHKLERLETVTMSNEEIVRVFPRAGRVQRAAIDEGRLSPEATPEERRRILRDYYEEKGYRRQAQLVGELVAQKLFRAVYAQNQVEEVMVDFWFNHFYVSVTDNQCRRFVGTYERDAIRPYVFGDFERMLVATARHPAMLLYLDNARSSAADGSFTFLDYNQERLGRLPGEQGRRYADLFARQDLKDERRRARMMEEMPLDAQPRRGINENYARELLELHTLGVDGGYGQEDVVAVARALTGWTVVPEQEKRRRNLRERSAKPLSLELGFVFDGDFFFNAGWHDAGEKRILGETLRRGGGLDEGERVLALLAEHPSTARHISHKLAVRFVSDDPPEELVDRLSVTFVESGGDMRAMLRQIVRSPGFWASDARRAKIKTPFELAASSLRALGADLRNPGQLNRWITRMGQPLYRYQAPTGFPDRAEMWVNAGSLLHRMNFGISLAAGQVKGVRIDYGVFVGAEGRHEPESPEAALAEFAALLLPERDLDDTLAVLRPLVGRPGVAQEIRLRAEEQSVRAADDPLDPPGDGDINIGSADYAERTEPTEPMTMAQILGLILGSPEFQRR